MTTPPFYFILTVKSPIKHVVINVIQNYSNLIRLPFQSMKYVHNIIILYTPVKQCIVLIVHKVFKINLSDIFFFLWGGVRWEGVSGQLPLDFLLASHIGYRGDVPHNDFGGLCFPCP